MIFNEQEIYSKEIYKKILFDKLSFNQGMIMENVVAQSLVCNGRKLYFYSKNDKSDSSNTMEIDFLVSKSNITSKHNIIPIEVKSGSNYTFSSLNKIKDKYKDYIGDRIIIHEKDLKVDDDILYLPIYMVGLI